MRTLLAALICSTLASCSGGPSRAFEAAGFDKRSVVIATLLDQKNSQRFSLQKAECELLIEEMRKIQPARTAVVEPGYAAGLFTGSSLQRQKIEVFVDRTGDGYFSHGTNQPVMFYSPTLYEFLKTIKTKSNKTVVDKPLPAPS